jgi:phosphoribosyl 1,2-cyclic phosphate phosphodiesterase
LRFTILGCGSSGGVPRLGGHWGDCDPENRATPAAAVRCWCSALTRAGITRVLIDTSPDLRAQLLDAGIGRARRGDLHP